MLVRVCVRWRDRNREREREARWSWFVAAAGGEQAMQRRRDAIGTLLKKIKGATTADSAKSTA